MKARPDDRRPGQWIARIACPRGCSSLAGHGRTAEEAEEALRKAMKRRHWRREGGIPFCHFCEEERSEAA